MYLGCIRPRSPHEAQKNSQTVLVEIIEVSKELQLTKVTACRVLLLRLLFTARCHIHHLHQT